ncbi:hypothetical protein TNCT_67161 [Trichonephila clavata]|uniref:Uncharacterized protein n=1 Tax=Trichonephila clavata TaxID=2740835 RepID=A0A8X6JHJ9_TRICU|nr:hypothetical protein TNCT_67161 [Trichonephila clavata]
MNRREHCLLPGEVIFIRRRMQCHLVQAECEFPNRNSNWDHIFKAAETTFQCAKRHTLQNNRHHMERKKKLCCMRFCLSHGETSLEKGHEKFEAYNRTKRSSQTRPHRKLICSKKQSNASEVKEKQYKMTGKRRFDNTSTFSHLTQALNHKRIDGLHGQLSTGQTYYFRTPRNPASNFLSGGKSLAGFHTPFTGWDGLFSPKLTTAPFTGRSPPPSLWC